jgi:hypothetical protein
VPHHIKDAPYYPLKTIFSPKDFTDSKVGVLETQSIFVLRKSMDVKKRCVRTQPIFVWLARGCAINFCNINLCSLAFVLRNPRYSDILGLSCVASINPRRCARQDAAGTTYRVKHCSRRERERVKKRVEAVP